jgi:RNA polymerase sigma-70 factor (ECF subfamily)
MADAAMDSYAATGDVGAFERLYDLLAPRLHAFLIRRTRDASGAEDLVQQTFLQMHAARAHFARGGEVMPWAFAIARRLLIDVFRKGERECGAGGLDEDPNDWACDRETPDALVARRRLTLRIEDELARMPEAHRVAFYLLQRDGLSVAEAAQILGTTPAAVKLRAHRAYKQLRAHLGADAREELGVLTP